MANEITIGGGNALASKLAYAETLAKSDLLPDAFKRNPGNVIWAIEFGEALGIPPITAINGIHVIKGKVTASANLISALVRRAGHKLRVTATDNSAMAEIVRADDPEFKFTATWTMDRARQAGLTGNPTWKNFPASMLKSRAITECARMACEEALNGIHYTPEELGAEVDGGGAPISAPVALIAESLPVAEWLDNDRKAFMARLTELGCKYEDVKAWLGAYKKTLPRDRSESQCRDLLTGLAAGTPPRKQFDEWLAKRTPKPAEAAQVQDAELHGDDGRDAAQPSADVLAGRAPAICVQCAKPFTWSDTKSAVCKVCSEDDKPL